MGFIIANNLLLNTTIDVEFLVSSSFRFPSKRSILTIGVRLSRCSSKILVITSHITKIVAYVALRENYSEQVIWGTELDIAQSSIPSSVLQVLPAKITIKVFPARSFPCTSHHKGSTRLIVFKPLCKF